MPRSNGPRAKRSSLLELSLFHMRKGDVFDTVRRLAKNLDAEALEYAVVGGLAVHVLGYSRATADVDLLLTRESLERFQERFVGRGYLPAFAGASTTFKDTETNVRIEVLVTGDFPGDGKPKAVAFPDPKDVSMQGEDFRHIRLEPLIELKLASGLSAPHRLRDLADVQDLIVAAKLPESLAGRLDASVQAEYLRLWTNARDASADV